VAGLAEVKSGADSVVDALNKITDWQKATPTVGGAGVLGKAVQEGADRWDRNPDGSIKVQHTDGFLDRLIRAFWAGPVGVAHADTLDDLKPGRGNSGPHPAPGLSVEGKTVSRGNPLPVTVVQSGGGSDSGGGFWSWLFGKDGGGSASASAGGGDDSGGGGGVGGAIHSAIHGALTGAAKAIFGGGNRGVGGWWTPERVKHTADRLQKEAGLSEMGAAGLVARWSGVEAAGGPSSRNPKSGAEGINQALGSRKPAGFSSWNLDKQLDYIIGTDLPSEGRALAQLRGAKTMADAAIGASMYERAEGYNKVTGIDNFTASTPVGRILKTLHEPSSPPSPHRPFSPTPHQHLSTMSALHPVTTSSTSNEMHVGPIHVHGVDTNNVRGVADRIADALRQTQLTTAANFGQA
jgi:hypothetical protein